jgi:hypothetical protein
MATVRHSEQIGLDRAMSAQSEKSRCLILSCSRTKINLPQPVPAIERYDGPPYKVLRRYLNEHPNSNQQLDIFILSAEYGLISGSTPIPDYDRRITPKRAEALNDEVLEKMRQEVLSKPYNEIFLSMGKAYLQAFAGINNLINGNTDLILSQATAGKKLTELKRWLWGQTPLSAKKSVEVVTVIPNTEPQTVTLRGQTITLITNEAVARLQAGIVQEPTVARRVRNWYVAINDEQISPKWAAQLLFGVQVSQFSADEARRVLRRLGLNCYQL